MAVNQTLELWLKEMKLHGCDIHSDMIKLSSWKKLEFDLVSNPGPSCSKGGDGGLWISSDGDDWMGAKIKTQKALRASKNTPKNPWTKN